MGIVNKIFTSVSGIYNNINPITLSGVNDIIVIEDKNGTMKCTEFQLRFGGIYFASSAPQTVHMYVNGKIVDISMTITSKGDLYFKKDDSKDFEVDYEELYRYLAKGIKKSLTDPIKSQLEYLAQELAPLKEKTSKFTAYYKKERLKNYNFRNRFILISNALKKDFYSQSNFNKIQNMLNSTDYYEWLIASYRRLLHLFKGSFKYPPNNKKSECNSEGCTSVTITFSLCSDKKIVKSIDDTFNGYLIKDVRKYDGLVARIEGCKVCRFKAYFPYLIFCKLFFDLRDSPNTRSMKLLEILEDEHNRLIGWNLFRRKKALKRDISFTLKLDSEDLKLLNLKGGKNEVVFKISGVNKQLEGNIYLWTDDARIVVSDIDGTITKSDVLGHIYSMMGKDWTHCGVASLYTKLVKNGYKIVYLTSRSLVQSFSTKGYLSSVDQDGHKLPEGPVLHSPDGVFAAIYREIIARRPEDFKIACLQGIKVLFGEKNPFVAGFGNKVTDVVTYKAMDIPTTRIFTINPNGELYAEFFKTLSNTYKSMNDFVDSLFPFFRGDKQPFVDHTYSDFSWWRMDDNFEE